MIFAKTLYALSVSKSSSHILLSLKTIKIKVQLNHKIKLSTLESMPHLDFQKQLCHRETDRDLLSFSPVSLNDPTEQKYVKVNLFNIMGLVMTTGSQKQFAH